MSSSFLKAVSRQARDALGLMMLTLTNYWAHARTSVRALSLLARVVRAVTLHLSQGGCPCLRLLAREQTWSLRHGVLGRRTTAKRRPSGPAEATLHTVAPVRSQRILALNQPHSVPVSGLLLPPPRVSVAPSLFSLTTGGALLESVPCALPRSCFVAGLRCFRCSVTSLPHPHFALSEASAPAGLARHVSKESASSDGRQSVPLAFELQHARTLRLMPRPADTT